VNATRRIAQPSNTIPHARIAKPSRFSLAWILPLVAAIIAGWLVFKNVRKTGPSITILFKDGAGLQDGQTVIRYRGVRVGEIRSVGLSGDAKLVQVNARLDRSAAGLAREGTSFWVVRPEFSPGGLRGLETIVSGSYIQLQPGAGKPEFHFLRRDQAPLMQPLDDALEVLVVAPHAGSLTSGSPVYFRGVEVGKVRYFQLGDDATSVTVHVRIEQRFAPLVRSNSVFWNAGGLNVDLRLFGVDVSAESFKSLLVGGIAFATPSPPGIAAPPETIFALHEKPEDQWLKWAPTIPLAKEQ